MHEIYYWMKLQKLYPFAWTVIASMQHRKIKQSNEISINYKIESFNFPNNFPLSYERKFQITTQKRWRKKTMKKKPSLSRSHNGTSFKASIFCRDNFFSILNHSPNNNIEFRLNFELCSHFVVLCAIILCIPKQKKSK